MVKITTDIAALSEQQMLVLGKLLIAMASMPHEERMATLRKVSAEIERRKSFPDLKLVVRNDGFVTDGNGHIVTHKNRPDISYTDRP